MNGSKEIAMMENGVVNIPKDTSLEDKASMAVTLVDDLVLKNYITKLTEYDIIPLDKSVIEKTFWADGMPSVSLFKINKMVYQKDEYATYKFASVFNAVQNLGCTVFVIADSNGDKTDFYMGVRSDSDANPSANVSSTLRRALSGQFPGVNIDKDKTKDEAKDLLARIKGGIGCVASVTCVANNKDEEFTNNKNFLQGLEKLAIAMRDHQYTAIIVADSVTTERLNFIRRHYEDIYSQLSPLKEKQLTYGTDETYSLSHAFSLGKTFVTSRTDTIAHSESSQKSTSTPEPPAKGVGTFIKGLLGIAPARPTTTEGGGTSDSNSRAYGTNEGENTVYTINAGKTDSTSKTKQLTAQDKSISGVLERIDAHLERLQECESVGMWECAAYFLSKRKDTAEIAAATYKAIVKGENSGVEMSAVNCWKPPTSGEDAKKQTNIDRLVEYITNFVHPSFRYYVWYKNTPVTPASLVSGNELAIHMGLPRKSVPGLPVIEHADFGKEVTEFGSSSIELGKIVNMGMKQSNSVKLDLESLTMHTFVTGSTGSGKSNTVYEMLARLMDSGIKCLVIEPAKGEYKNIFGNRNGTKGMKALGTNPKYSELLRINPFKFPSEIHVLEHTDRLIEIFNVCWPMYAAMPAILKDAVLRAYEVCGWDMSESTNRYKSEFGVDMFPTFADLQAEIRAIINDSSYSQEMKGNYVGALETRVKSLTNGLNGRIFCAHETDNKLLFDENVIVDLSRIGSLETKSLIMGILVMRLNEYRVSEREKEKRKEWENVYGIIDQVDNLIKFVDEGKVVLASKFKYDTLLEKLPYIVEQIEEKRKVSKGDEGKSIDEVISYLKQVVANKNKGMNADLKHVTVLEEAHNILKRTSTEQNPEGSNMTGKSVELLSNSIAEMRTYGEGFIIADQSPNAVDMSAIRNTNTKIIMRLPDETDRRLAGKSAALNDEQLDEIAKLPIGVAVVYQNDWVEPVLCKIDKFKDEEKPYKYEPAEQASLQVDGCKFRSELVKLIGTGNIKKSDMYFIKSCLKRGVVAATATTINILEILQDYEVNGDLRILGPAEKSKLVSEIFDCSAEVKSLWDSFVRRGRSDRAKDLFGKDLMKKVKSMTTGLSHKQVWYVCRCIMPMNGIGEEVSKKGVEMEKALNKVAEEVIIACSESIAGLNSKS